MKDKAFFIEIGVILFFKILLLFFVWWIFFSHPTPKQDIHFADNVFGQGKAGDK